MEVLRVIWYTILAIVGIGVAIGVGAIASLLSGIIGLLALGAFIILVVTVAIKEWFDDGK